MSSINRLVLASASPYRRQLLAGTGLHFKVQTAAVDEASITAGDPATLAAARARAKARAVAAGWPETAVVIGADQVMEFEGRPFDKVETAEAALAVLGRLAGRTHWLHSAYTLVSARPAAEPVEVVTRVISVEMTMRPLTAGALGAYVATGEWRGSVGCYKFEGVGAHLFERMAGDQSAIIGLPLGPLLADLRRAGVDGLASLTPPW